MVVRCVRAKPWFLGAWHGVRLKVKMLETERGSFVSSLLTGTERPLFLRINARAFNITSTIREVKGKWKRTGKKRWS